MVRWILFCAIAAFAPHPVVKSFDMNDPKGVSGLTLSIDSPLEPVQGHTNAVSGTIQFDPLDPSKSTGEIIVQAAKVSLGSPDLSKAMHENALLADEHPTIRFKVTSVTDLEQVGDGEWECIVVGDFTLVGKTKSLMATARVTHLPDKLADRGGVQGKDGDLLVVRAQMEFDRLDFGVMPDLSIIGNVVKLDMAAVGVWVR